MEKSISNFMLALQYFGCQVSSESGKLVEKRCAMDHDVDNKDNDQHKNKAIIDKHGENKDE